MEGYIGMNKGTELYTVSGEPPPAPSSSIRRIDEKSTDNDPLHANSLAKSYASRRHSWETYTAIHDTAFATHAAGAGYSDDVDSWYPLPEEEEDTKEDDDGIKEEENSNNKKEEQEEEGEIEGEREEENIILSRSIGRKINNKWPIRLSVSLLALLTILISALALRTPINHQAIKESGERGEEGHDDLFNDEEEGGGEEEEEEMDTNPLVDSETQRELLNALDELEKILREEEKYMGI